MTLLIQPAVWSEWTQFLVGEFKARAFKLQVCLKSTGFSSAGTLSGLKLVADVPDRWEQEREVIAPAGGVTINYAVTFMAGGQGVSHSP